MGMVDTMAPAITRVLALHLALETRRTTAEALDVVEAAGAVEAAGRLGRENGGRCDESFPCPHL